MRHKLIRWLCVWGVLGGTFGGLTCSSSAQTINSWIDGSGKWETATNWSLGVAPVNNQTVLITNSATKTVNIDSVTVTNAGGTNMTIGNLWLDAPLGFTNTLVEQTGGNVTPLHLFGTAYVGQNGVLDVYNSRFQVDSIGGGIPLRIDGTVWFNGNGGQITVTNGPIFVGNTMIQSNSTTLFAREILVTYNPSQQGTLTVVGGTLNLSSYLDIGASNSAVGTLWLGGGARLVVTNASTIIGDSGVGEMTVFNGTVQAKDVTVGKNAGSQGTLNMADSGTMSVSSNLLVGGSSNSVSMVAVAGGALRVTNDTHSAVTEVRYGTLTMTGGVFITDSLVITNPSGSFVNNGGTLTITGQAQFDQGTQTFASGTSVLSSNLAVGSTANSTGTVNVTGTLVVTNGVLSAGNNGTITGGAGAGLIAVSGTGTVLASTILLGSSAGGQGDVIQTNGGTIRCVGTNCLISINSKTWTKDGSLVWSNANAILACGVTAPGDFIPVSGPSYLQELFVGFSDVGTMTMSGGTMDIASKFIVGHIGPPFSTAVSTGAVWITGGQVTVTTPSSSCIIGNSGVGQMTLSNGTVTATTMIVGNGSNCGTLTVAGDTMNVYGSLTVGDCGLGHVGVVTIAGGNLFVTNAAHTAVLTVHNGTLTLSSGLLQADNIVMTDTCAHFARTGGVLNYGSAVLDPTRDDDGDGILNGWELSHGLNPLDATDAANDNDGDGLSNLREYQLGTDPNDPSSPYRITAITKEGANMRVTWSTVGGKTNVVQASPGGAGGNYTNNFGDLNPQLIISGSIVTSTNFVESGGANNGPARYYRIRLVP